MVNDDSQSGLLLANNHEKFNLTGKNGELMRSSCIKIVLMVTIPDGQLWLMMSNNLIINTWRYIVTDG